MRAVFSLSVMAYSNPPVTSVVNSSTGMTVPWWDLRRAFAARAAEAFEAFELRSRDLERDERLANAAGGEPRHAPELDVVGHVTVYVLS
jgi:hypothetical protein